MATASPDRLSLRCSIHRSRWLNELVQRADRKISDHRDSRLDGDRKQAIAACKAVAAQASAENNRALAEEYDGHRARLDG